MKHFDFSFWNYFVFKMSFNFIFKQGGVCLFSYSPKKSKLKWNLRIDSTWNCSWIFDFTMLFFLRCVWLQDTSFSPPKFASWFIKNHSEHQPLWRGAAATIEYFFHGCQLQKERGKKRSLAFAFQEIEFIFYLTGINNKQYFFFLLWGIVLRYLFKHSVTF